MRFKKLLEFLSLDEKLPLIIKVFCEKRICVQKIVDNNIYQGLRAKVRITEWRKC